MDRWTDGQTNGWTHVDTETSRGRRARLAPVPAPHSGGRGSQGKEVGQGCALGTGPALGGVVMETQANLP